MPRPVRSRVAPAAPKGTAASAPRPADAEPVKAATTKVSHVETVSDTSSDIYGLSDREIERQAAGRASAVTIKAKSALQAPSTARKTRSATPSDSRRSSSRLHKSAPDVSGMDATDDSELFGGNLDDLDADISLGEDSTLTGGQRSTDTSSFNVRLFRRGRPRQSSIVGRDDAPIRPSSRGPNTPSISTTFNIGTFKRRAREQSILGSRRKALHETEETQSPPGVEQEEDGDAGSDEVIPESDYGSPSRRRTRGSDTRTRQPSLFAVETSPEEGLSRKRKSTNGQDGSSKRPALTTSEPPQASIESDSELSLPPLDDPPSTPGHDKARPATMDGADDDILAPPASSSSSDASPTSWPSLHNLPRSRQCRALSDSCKTPAPTGGQDELSDMSSPPSLTHSPNYVAPKAKNTRAAAAAAKNARQPSPKLTTAELTAMLPKRRHRVMQDDQSDEEFDSTVVANEADELSYVEGSRVRRTRRPAMPLAESNAPSVQAQATKGSKKRARRTYGSRTTAGSDEENQGGGEGDTIQVAVDEEGHMDDALPDDTFDATDDPGETREKLSDELQQAAQKFKEVDRWEMEFEEVTEPSSPGAATAR